MWLLSGVKGTYRNLWKDISKELLSFAHLVLCVAGEGKQRTFGKISGWGKATYSCFDHSSSFKNCLVSELLVWRGLLLFFVCVSSFFIQLGSWMLSLFYLCLRSTNLGLGEEFVGVDPNPSKNSCVNPFLVV